MYLCFTTSNLYCIHNIVLIYLSQALRLLDSSGVVLEKVCGPVREYLYNRNDTVRCIVASLTNDCESDLAEVHTSAMLSIFGRAGATPQA